MPKNHQLRLLEDRFVLSEEEFQKPLVFEEVNFEKVSGIARWAQNVLVHGTAGLRVDLRGA